MLKVVVTEQCERGPESHKGGVASIHCFTILVYTLHI